MIKIPDNISLQDTTFAHRCIVCSSLFYTYGNSSNNVSVVQTVLCNTCQTKLQRINEEEYKKIIDMEKELSILKLVKSDLIDMVDWYKQMKKKLS